jgi:hypothetical protein
MTLYLSDYFSSVWPKFLTRAVSVAQGFILNSANFEEIEIFTTFGSYGGLMTEPTE